MEKRKKKEEEEEEAERRKGGAEKEGRKKNYKGALWERGRWEGGCSDVKEKKSRSAIFSQ